MKDLGITVLKVVQTAGIVLVLFFVIFHCVPTAHAYNPLVEAPKVSFIERIFQQLHGVATFTAEAIQAVLAFDGKNLTSSSSKTSSLLTTTSNTNTTVPLGKSTTTPANFFDDSARSLIVNVPLIVTGQFTAQGVSDFSSMTVHHSFVSTGNTEVNALLVHATAQLNGLSVFGSASVGQLQVSGNTTLHALNVTGSTIVSGAVTAKGGLVTNGADINAGTGNVYAANLITGLTAGANIKITGSANAPIISAQLPGYSYPDLALVRKIGGCPECITNSDIQKNLTISGGLIDNTPIGLSSATSAVFTNVRIGTTTATSALSVYGDIKVTGGCVEVNGTCLGGGVSSLDDLSDVTVATTSKGQVLLYNGTQWVNVATSSLGFTAATFLGLSDTPNFYIPNALSYVNASGTALTQSSNLVFTGIRLGVGTSTPIDTLSIAGNIGVLGKQTMRFYNALNTHFVGFRASSTIASSTVWNLPPRDGASNELLVTDGSGNLRFASVGSVGGGSATYLGLSDTPSSFINKAIPYVASSSLTFSPTFTFDGSHLGLGTNAPTSTLTVQGSVRFQAGTTTVGLVYNSLSNRVGIGTANPTSLVDVQGGSIIQRGAPSGGSYTPAQLGSIDLPDNANDVVVVGSYAYVVTAGTGNDFHVIDISNPNSPVEISSLNLSDGANAVYISGKYAYVVTNLNGNDFHVIDISNPSTPVEVGGIGLSTTASDVTVQGRYAYVTTTGTGNDFHIIDVSSATTPIEVGSLDLPDGANGVDVSGNYAYVVTKTNGDGFYVINVSTSTTPVVTGSMDLPAAANDVAVQGQYAYVVSDFTGDDFHVISIANPTTPSLVGSLDMVTSANALSVNGRYAYVVTAGTGNDFHVIDISAPTTPVEIGSVDLASGAGLSVAVAGRYAYMVTSSLGNDFHVMDITGIDVQSEYVDSLQAGTFSALGDLKVAGGLSLGKGLRSGIAGLQSDGSLYIQGTASSFIKNKLGVGTSTPSQILTVAGNLRLTGAIYDSTNSPGTKGWILQSTGTSTRWIATSTVGFSPAFTNSMQLANLLSDEAGSGSVVFGTNATLLGTTTAVNANFSGNIGIGTVNPSKKLQIVDAAGNLLRLSSDTFNTADWDFTRNISNGALLIQGSQVGNNNIGLAPTSGSVGIGTTSPNTFKLQVAGNVGPDANNSFNLGAAGKNWGCLYYNGGTTGVCASDQRLKTNITDLSFDNGEATALEQLTALRPRSFAYKTATSSIYHGLIAQEVQRLSPELVVQDGATSMFAVNYGDVQWLTIEAVKELNLDLQELLTNGTTSASSSLASLFATNTDTVWSRLSKLAHGFVDGVLTVVGIHAQQVSTDSLCVGATCMNEDQLKTILQNNGTANVTSHNSVTTTNANQTGTQEQNTASSSPVAATTTPEGSIASSSLDTNSSTTITSEPDTADTSTTTEPVAQPVIGIQDSSSTHP